MREYDFLVTLKQRSFTLVDTISRFMLLLSFIVFFYNAATLTANRNIIYGVIASAIVIWFVYATYTARNKPIFYRLGLLIAAVGWIYGGHSYIAIGVLFIVAAILEKQVKFPEEIGVYDEGLVFNTLPKKHVEWKKVTNMVIKDGMLTIDYINNKLFQKELDGNISKQLETEFNEFCSTHIATVKMSYTHE